MLRKSIVLAIAIMTVFTACSGKKENTGGSRSASTETAQSQSGGNSGIAYGSFTDTRDGKTYRTVQIGNLTWMAENLNYEADGSWFYNDDPANGAKYGRLYTWDSAMTVAPAGWRLSTSEDWRDLISAVEDYRNEGMKLKSTIGWSRGNGTDDFGFSALPGGVRDEKGNYLFAGGDGFWWRASEYDPNFAWFYQIGSGGYVDGDRPDSKQSGRSVRLVKE